AAEIHAHDTAFKQGHRDVIKRARELLAHHGYDPRALTTNLRSGHVEDDIPALDVVSRTVANDYPEHFHGYDRHDERLADLLPAGNPEAMPQREAYEQALDQLRQQYGEYGNNGRSEWIPSDEPIPESLRPVRPSETQLLERDGRPEGKLRRSGVSP